MLKQMMQKSANALGYSIVKNPKEWAREQNVNEDIPYDMSHTAFKDIYPKCNPFTMTTMERQFMLVEAVNYICANKIEGDIVECGVWRGGSSMTAAEALLKNNDTSRTLYLYDTYEGMTAPTEKDTRMGGHLAYTQKQFDVSQKDDGINTWCYASLEDVKENMATTGYPQDKLHFVKGDVLKTIPETMPEKISILRLDTDFYDSSKHELEHLYPRLVKGGVLILDDYGIWDGQRKAVEEYFGQHNINLLIVRVDSSCRIAIKN